MTDEAAEYTSSLDADKIIFEADIKTNFAHTSMLKHEGIIDAEIADNILCALDELKEEGYDALVFDPSVEDVHMAIENYVTSKIGPKAGYMHTAKSRNDQVATDIRLVLRERIVGIQIGILEFIEGLVEMAGEHLNDVFIGFTHLQHAQPITIAHHLMAHAQALKRDYERLEDTYKRVNLNPLGCAAMATTSFPINRELTTKLLGFDAYLENSMDGVSARDFIAETVFDLTSLCTTLSKICEELILWSTYEFGVIEMADEYSSTSSIMPQKKNPDVAELAGRNFATATDLADIMVREKDIPFRTAHKIVGRIVNEATSNNMAEEDITSEFIDGIAVDLGFDKLSLDDELIQNALNPAENVKIRRVVGGPAPEMVELARNNIKEFLNEEFEKKGI